MQRYFEWAQGIAHTVVSYLMMQAPGQKYTFVIK